VITAKRDAETIGVAALAVGEEAVEFVKIIRILPWTVIVVRFSAGQQIAGTDLLRYAENGPPKAIHAAFDLDKVLRQRLEEHHVGRCSRAVVADIGIIRTFLEIHPLHQFRDHGVHVRVPLTVRVRGEIQRHTVEGEGDIRAVIEIETAKKILVGLAAAGVLRDDETGNRLQNFSRTENRTIFDFFCAHRSLSGGVGNSDKAVLPALHLYVRAHDAHRQSDAQRSRFPTGPDGDRQLFGCKTGARYDKLISASRESRNTEGAAAI